MAGPVLSDDDFLGTPQAPPQAAPSAPAPMPPPQAAQPPQAPPAAPQYPGQPPGSIVVSRAPDGSLRDQGGTSYTPGGVDPTGTKHEVIDGSAPLNDGQFLGPVDDRLAPPPPPAPPRNYSFMGMQIPDMQARDAAMSAQMAANRAAPLVGPIGAIGDAFNGSLANLKRDTGDWFSKPPPTGGDGILGPFLQGTKSLGDMAGLLASPATGLVNGLLVNPASKLTGLPKSDIGTILAGLGGEGGVAADVAKAPMVSSQVADLANLASSKYGLNLRGTQIAAANERAGGVVNGPAAIRDSQLLKAPGSGYAANQSGLLKDFTKAVSNTIGLDTQHLTPSAIDTAFTNIGNTFDTAGARNGVGQASVGPLSSRLDQILGDAGLMGLPDNQMNALQAHAAMIKNAAAANGGQIPGDAYLNLTQSGSPLSKVAKADHTAFGDSAGDMLDALHDGAVASADPADVAALQQARGQYKNLMTILPLAAKAGADGIISPLGLQGRVMAKFGNSYARGTSGDLGDLSRIGQLIGDKTSDSGTAARLSDMLRHGGAEMAASGALGVEALHDPMRALQLAGVGAAAATARYAGNAMRGAKGLSPAYRNGLLGVQAPRALPSPNVAGLLGTSYVGNSLTPDQGGLLAH